MATYAQFKHVELYKIGHGKNRVPNAPKSCIAEIFSSDSTDGSPVKQHSSRPRVVRDTPTRPRDTHSRLFGNVKPSLGHPMSPMVTDTIRSNIKFGGAVTNGNSSPPQSPSKPMMNGSASSTPSRGELENGDHSSYAPLKRNPVTGDGVMVPTPRRRHPAAGLRGADPLEPQPTHKYYSHDWPPPPARHYVESVLQPVPNYKHNALSLLGLKSDDSEKTHPVIDPDSLSPQPILDRHWPPFPAQHYLEPKDEKFEYHPLPPYAFVGMTSALGDRPLPDYKHNPISTFDGKIDPFLIANTNPPPTLFKYERGGPIPDVTLLDTPLTRGPHTLAGFPPIFPKHVPGYLFDLNRHAEDLRPPTHYVDYVRQRAMEGNPITGEGYKSMNGQINTVTLLNGNSHSHIFHNRVPPGGYSSRLW